MPEVTHPPEFRFAVDQDCERVIVRMAGERDRGVAGDVAAAVEELIAAWSLIRGPWNVQRVLEVTAPHSLFTFVRAETDH